MSAVAATSVIPTIQQTLSELLADGLFIDGDWIESKDQNPDGEVRLIQLADIGDGVFRDRSSRFLTLEKARELRCTFLEPGDILLARMPEPLGRACIFPGVGQPAVTAVDVCILRPNPERVRAEWLVNAINSREFRSSMQAFVRGTTRQRISRKNLGTLRIMVPGLDEQLTIADFIERVESKRAAAARHTLEAKAAIERFSQSVVRDACSGRLTADWRKGEPASVSRLPEGWRECVLDDLGAWKTGGTPSRKHPEFFGGPIAWIKSGDLRDGPVTTTEETITEDGLRNSPAKLMPAGTVSVALYGATIGRLGVLEVEAATNQACANCIPNDDLVDRWFLFYYLLGQRTALVAAGQGGAQPNLTNAIVRGWPISLPPIAEQKEIVRRLRKLLIAATDIQTQVATAAEKTDRASDAVVAKALRGELVAG